MRRWVSALAVLAGLVCAAPDLADSPVKVYNDFASDGALSCGHSRAALNGALKDASLQQYGDPLTFVQMKLAIRKQLAGGCRVLASATPTQGTTPTGPGESSPGAVPSEQTNQKQKARKGPGGSSSEQSTRKAAAPIKASGPADAKHSGAMILLGISLLLLVLGSSGWAARRAFGDRG